MSTASPNAGLFIVLEGIDGAGTTTQSQALAEFLRARGEKAVVTSQPSSGPIGRLIRQVLKGQLETELPDGSSEPVDPATIALLFAADRLNHLKAEVIPNLAAGVHVICDRYVVSSFVYQGVEVDLDFVLQINQQALHPDLMFFVNVDPEVAMRRIDGSREERERFENLPFQREVAANYERELQAYRACPVVEVDGEMDIADVTTAICHRVAETLHVQAESA
jgi:dTMP kinase